LKGEGVEEEGVYVWMVYGIQWGTGAALGACGVVWTEPRPARVHLWRQAGCTIRWETTIRQDTRKVRAPRAPHPRLRGEELRPAPRAHTWASKQQIVRAMNVAARSGALYKFGVDVDCMHCARGRGTPALGYLRAYDDETKRVGAGAAASCGCSGI
jgi:hypothetical protein